MNFKGSAAMEIDLFVLSNAGKNLTSRVNSALRVAENYPILIGTVQTQKIMVVSGHFYNMNTLVCPFTVFVLRRFECIPVLKVLFLFLLSFSDFSLRLIQGQKFQ